MFAEQSVFSLVKFETSPLSLHTRNHSKKIVSCLQHTHYMRTACFNNIWCDTCFKNCWISAKSEFQHVTCGNKNSNLATDMWYQQCMYSHVHLKNRPRYGTTSCSICATCCVWLRSVNTNYGMMQIQNNNRLVNLCFGHAASFRHIQHSQKHHSNGQHPHNTNMYLYFK